MSEQVTPLSKYRKYPPEVIVLTDWLHDQDRLAEAGLVLTAYELGKLAVLPTISFPQDIAYY